MAKTAPATSSRAGTSLEWVGSTRRMAMISTTMMGGLTRKTDRQPMNSVQMPPSTTPALAPAAVAAAKTPSARVRAGPSSNRSVMMATAWGATNAALAPWQNRAAIKAREVGASPAASDVMPKAVMLMRSTRR